MSEVNCDSCVLVAGKRKSGKTVLVKKMIEISKDNFDQVYVFSGLGRNSALQFKQSLQGHPKVFYGSYNEQSIMETIEYARNQQKKPRRLFVMDDVLAAPDYKKSSKCLASLSTASRHLCIGVIIITQNITDISTTVRRNCTDLYAFRSENYNEREVYKQDFGGVLHGKMHDILTRLPQYYCLHINIIGKKTEFHEITLLNGKIHRFDLLHGSIDNSTGNQ